MYNRRSDTNPITGGPSISPVRSPRNGNAGGPPAAGFSSRNKHSDPQDANPYSTPLSSSQAAYGAHASQSVNLPVTFPAIRSASQRSAYNSPIHAQQQQQPQFGSGGGMLSHRNNAFGGGGASSGSGVPQGNVNVSDMVQLVFELRDTLSAEINARQQMSLQMSEQQQYIRRLESTQQQQFAQQQSVQQRTTEMQQRVKELELQQRMESQLAQATAQSIQKQQQQLLLQQQQPSSPSALSPPPPVVDLSNTATRNDIQRCQQLLMDLRQRCDTNDKQSERLASQIQNTTAQREQQWQESLSNRLALLDTRFDQRMAQQVQTLQSQIQQHVTQSELQQFVAPLQRQLHESEKYNSQFASQLQREQQQAIDTLLQQTKRSESELYAAQEQMRQQLQEQSQREQQSAGLKLLELQQQLERCQQQLQLTSQSVSAEVDAKSRSLSDDTDAALRATHKTMKETVATLVTTVRESHTSTGQALHALKQTQVTQYSTLNSQLDQLARRQEQTQSICEDFAQQHKSTQARLQTVDELEQVLRAEIQTRLQVYGKIKSNMQLLQQQQSEQKMLMLQSPQQQQQRSSKRDHRGGGGNNNDDEERSSLTNSAASASYGSGGGALSASKLAHVLQTDPVVKTSLVHLMDTHFNDKQLPMLNETLAQHQIRTSEKIQITTTQFETQHQLHSTRYDKLKSKLAELQSQFANYKQIALEKPAAAAAASPGDSNHDSVRLLIQSSVDPVIAELSLVKQMQLTDRQTAQNDSSRLNSRLDAETTSHQSALAMLQSDVTELRTHFKTLEQQTDDVSKSALSARNTQLDALELSLNDATKTQRAYVDRAVEQLQQQLTKHAETVQNTASKHKQQSSLELAEVDAMKTDLQLSIQSLRVDLTSLDAALQNAIRAQSDDSKQLHSATDDMLLTHTDLSTRVDAVDDRVHALQASLNAMQRLQDELSLEEEEEAQQLYRQMECRAVMDDMLAHIVESQPVIVVAPPPPAASHSSTTTTTGAVEKKLSAHDDRLKSIETTVNQLILKSNAHTTDLKSLHDTQHESSLNSASTRRILDTHTSAVDTLVDTVQQHKLALAQLRSVAETNDRQHGAEIHELQTKTRLLQVQIQTSTSQQQSSPQQQSTNSQPRSPVAGELQQTNTTMTQQQSGLSSLVQTTAQQQQQHQSMLSNFEDLTLRVDRCDKQLKSVLATQSEHDVKLPALETRASATMTALNDLRQQYELTALKHDKRTSLQADELESMQVAHEKRFVRCEDALHEADQQLDKIDKQMKSHELTLQQHEKALALQASSHDASGGTGSVMHNRRSDRKSSVSGDSPPATSAEVENMQNRVTELQAAMSAKTQHDDDQRANETKEMEVIVNRITKLYKKSKDEKTGTDTAIRQLDTRLHECEKALNLPIGAVQSSLLSPLAPQQAASTTPRGSE